MVDLNQLLHQGLKATKLGDFLFCRAHRARRSQGLSRRPTGDFLRESSQRPMSGTIGLSTMAIRLPAASMNGRYGTGLKIPEDREFPQEIATAVEHVSAMGAP